MGIFMFNQLERGFIQVMDESVIHRILIQLESDFKLKLDPSGDRGISEHV